MNITKTIGWITFVAGITIIGSTIYYTYNIFTGVTLTPQIFKIDLESPETTETEGGTLEENLKQMFSEQLKGLIPLESMNKFSNLVAWTTGAWIIIIGGGKISELGIKLISAPSEKNS